VAYQDSRNFRIDLNATLERYRCSVVERRVVAGRMQLATWGEDATEEPDEGTSEITMRIDGAPVPTRQHDDLRVLAARARPAVPAVSGR
jgi:hypothetical protein